MANVNDDQLVERLVPKIMASIRAKAKAVETIPIKDDLKGITSLPAYDTTGQQFKQVLVPLASLKEPALEAAEIALEAAKQAGNASKIIVCTEQEYAEWGKKGELVENKLYFLYDEEE